MLRGMINQLCDRRPCYGAPHPGTESDTNLIRQASRSYLVWSKNSNGLTWHNLRLFPRFSSNRFRKSSHSTYNPPSTTRSMRSERVQNDLGATAGLCYRNGRPRTSFTERVSGSGEPHPESPD